MMRNNFQFCFCKYIEDNKIPYQKLLIMPQPYHCLAVSFDDNVADNQKNIYSPQSYHPTHPPPPCKRYERALLSPKHPTPCMMTTSQSIQRTPWRTSSRVAPAPQRSLERRCRSTLPTPYTGPVVSSGMTGRKVVETWRMWTQSAPAPSWDCGSVRYCA